MAVAALRSDRAARALRGGEFPEPAEAVPPLSARTSVAQREARARTLSRVHAVRRRHRRLGFARRRCRASDDVRRLARSARAQARRLRDQVQQPEDSRRRPGRMPSVEPSRSAAPCFAPWTSSIGLASRASSMLLGPGRKDESGDFTKGAGLSRSQIAAIAAFTRSGASVRRLASASAETLKDRHALDSRPESRRRLERSAPRSRTSSPRAAMARIACSFDRNRRARPRLLHGPGVRGAAHVPGHERRGRCRRVRFRRRRRPLRRSDRALHRPDGSGQRLLARREPARSQRSRPAQVRPHSPSSR